MMPSDLSRWVWPRWLEDLASRPSDPDGHARLPSPDALDWELHGLPSDPNHAQGIHIVRGLGGLGSFPHYDTTPLLKSGQAEWWSSHSAPDFASLTPDQRLELAFLISLRRGADPWGWGDPSSDGVPIQAQRMLGEMFSRQLLLAARAMLAHPSCPSEISGYQFTVIVAEIGRPKMTLPLPSGLALVGDLEGVNALAQKWKRFPGQGDRSALASARSAKMAKKLLGIPHVQAHDVFQALAQWLLPKKNTGDLRTLSDTARSDMIREAGAWWRENGLGGEDQWSAQLACLRAIVHKSPSNPSPPTPQDEMELWLHEVGRFRGNIWLPASPRQDPEESSENPGVLQGMNAVPAGMVHTWLVDRSNTKELWGSSPGSRPPGEPWYWQNRMERLEVWKRLEEGLGKVESLTAWERAWGRFWSWVPPLQAWSEDDAKQAARLWGMEHRPCHWPPLEWKLDEMGPEVLVGLPESVKQIAGEAFALSIVENPLVSEQAPALGAGLEWWGGRVRERVRWLESWLETPGWKVPALTPNREAVLMAWPAGKTDASPQSIAALWAGRVMDDTLDSPSPARAVFRTRI